jgi:hypothetical protein
MEGAKKKNLIVHEPQKSERSSSSNQRQRLTASQGSPPESGADLTPNVLAWKKEIKTIARLSFLTGDNGIKNL